MIRFQLTAAALASLFLVTAAPVQAAKCVKKAAIATSTSESSAKWFALETMVQSVSWGLWPGFVATGKVDGYTIRRQKYKCQGTGSVTCRGQALFCKN